jgi:hypothetical protein
VLNAGATPTLAPVHQQSWEQFARVWETDVKATFSFGREALLLPLDERERELLARYVDRFNACDFDAVRAMLADEVRLDLIGRAKFGGVAEVGQYFDRYAQVDDWRLALGVVEGRPAILVDDPREGRRSRLFSC